MYTCSLHTIEAFSSFEANSKSLTSKFYVSKSDAENSKLFLVSKITLVPNKSIKPLIKPRKTHPTLSHCNTTKLCNMNIEHGKLRLV